MGVSEYGYAVCAAVILTWRGMWRRSTAGVIPALTCRVRSTSSVVVTRERG